MKIYSLFQQVQRWWALALVVFALDWITKQWVETSIAYAQTISVFPFFNLTLRYNTGAAFSFLADMGGWQRWFFSFIALAVVVAISWRLVKISTTNRWEALSLSLILGGAMGNLYDRLFYGHVVDFLELHWQHSWFFPAFNIADSAITLGVVLMLFESLVAKPQKGTKK
ncbi:MAG: signal peptidase II [Marinomonas sp.]